MCLQGDGALSTFPGMGLFALRATEGPSAPVSTMVTTETRFP